MNVIIYIAGGYLIYAAILMKIRGTVASAFLSKNLNWETARDKKGYIRIMFPVNLIMGLIMVATGLLLTYGEKLGIKGSGGSIVLLISFIFCIIYAVIAMHAQNKYLK